MKLHPTNGNIILVNRYFNVKRSARMRGVFFFAVRGGWMAERTVLYREFPGAFPPRPREFSSRLSVFIYRGARSYMGERKNAHGRGAPARTPPVDFLILARPAARPQAVRPPWTHMHTWTPAKNRLAPHPQARSGPGKTPPPDRKPTPEAG